MKYIAVHEVHTHDAKGKSLIAQPGQEITIEDKDEAARLLSVGAIARLKDKKHLPPLNVAADLDVGNDADDGDDTDDDADDGDDTSDKGAGDKGSDDLLGKSDEKAAKKSGKK